MSIGSTADLDAMLAECGVPCINGLSYFSGILNESSTMEQTDGMMVQVNETTLLCRTGAYGSLVKNAAILVDGIGYTVRRWEPEDDGGVMRLWVTKTVSRS